MAFPDVIIMGFGKMPADCAAILAKNNVLVHGIWETEESQFSALQGSAKRLNIPYARPTRKEMGDLLCSLEKPTVIFSINNNYIFPERVRRKQNLRIVNFHNSLLPHYPGHGRVIPCWVIFNGERLHGVTWHLVSTDIDAGNILCQGDFELSENGTAWKVMMRCISLGIELFAKHWREFMSPHNRGHAQRHTHQNVYGKDDIPNHGEIDLSWDFYKTSRFLRSMDYGVFKLLPPPKIRLDDKWYAVKGYKFKTEENRSPKREIQVVRTPEGKASDATILFPEGAIELSITEEN